MSEQTRTRCIYTVLENGVHEMVMTESSRLAVDEFIEVLVELTDKTYDKQESVLILFDTRVGVQPINYVFSRVQGLTKQYKPTGQTTKLAMIMQSNALIKTIEALMHMLRFLRVRFFSPQDRDKAIAWLLEK